MMGNLRNRLDELNKRSFLIQVTFVGLNDKPIRDINNAFRLADSRERLDLFVSLFFLWFDATKSEKFGVTAREAEIVFGQTFLNFADHRLFFTLTEAGNEFRIWYSMPKVFGPDHVDCGGQGLLAEVKGDPTSVAKYIKVMMGLHSLNVVHLSNNVRIFLKLEGS
jgi:hypothetical protein